MSRAKAHRWNARQRLTLGPFYRTLSAGVSSRKGLTTRAGTWHLKVTRTLHLDLANRTYGWNHAGPGAVAGPVPAWRILFPLALVVALLHWSVFGTLRRFGIALVVVLVGLVTLGWI